VAGDKQAYLDVKSILDASYNSVMYTGALGTAMIPKVLSNMLCGLQVCAMAEAMLIAKRSGIDVVDFWHAIRMSAGNSFLWETCGPNVFRGEYHDSFPIDLMCKDNQLGYEMARSAQVPLEVFGLMQQIYNRALYSLGPDVGCYAPPMLYEKEMKESLQAPGFANLQGKRAFADITNTDTFTMKVKSTTPTYAGFKMAFSAPNVPKTSIFGGGSYKAGFTLKDTQDWQIVEVPFTQFSYDWSGYTGRCDSKDPGRFGREGQQHYCCDKSGLEPSKPEVCVDSQFLSKVNELEIWAEGVEGDFNIQFEYIGASSSSLEV